MPWLLKFLFFAIIVFLMVVGMGGCGGGSSDTAGDNASGDTAGDISGTTGLVINEIVAKGADGGADWIELYVAGEEAVSLSEYFLTDDSDNREKASLPNEILAPGEFIVVQAVDEAPQDGSHYVPFKLGADDAVTLYRENSVIDILDWNDGDAPEGSSYGRFPDGTEEIMTLTPTPGDANQEQGDANQEIIRPEGWTEATHGEGVDADYDVVFEEGVVHRMDVTMAASDWEAMLDDMTSLYGTFGQGEGDRAPLADPVADEDQIVAQARNDGGIIGGGVENPIWVPCTVEYGGNRWLHVGIRFKGNSSLKSTWRGGIYKLPLRLDFDEFEDDYPEIHDQRFYGFQKLSFSSNWKDDSLIREKVAADIFRDAGVPAPRTAFYRLFVDHGDGPVYFGLYTMVEIPSEPMLESQFSGDGGNLYKPDGAGATFAAYNEASFDKETNEDEADFSDVEALFEALHSDRTDAETWRTGLESVFNASGFIRWLAVNTVIQNWDTYGVMSHNYYLYNDPETGLLNWIPWDNNEALGGGNGMRRALSLALAEVTDGWPLIRYLMDDTIYYGIYVEEVENTINFTFYPEYMQPTYEDAHNLIWPYVVGAEGEIPGYTLLSSPEAFETSVDALITHAEERYDEAMTFVSAY